ncbi:RNA-binding protein 25 isoform X2 [Aplysia californica]|uniref:RNA-binding protein 25 isoform X2 n=1 Tax=Aplysia californica TaxID=6500 RepID=A0ABM0K172_APLCA|nr:RNA-binding protein 25 isoform X2 [Aplysia californica]
MSFPGRPPVGMPGGMPGMAPRMMPTQGYAFAPMPGMAGMNTMMPMQMGMMAPVTNSVSGMMMRPMVATPQVPVQPQQHMKQNKKLVPQEIPKSSSREEKPPVTTVFVGNISERAPDMMIKQMLQRCGNVLSWKRVQGASGKLQAFGFCEYEDPEATLRCIRLLNEWQISEKKLVVKVDAKTKTLLDEYRKKKNKTEGKETKKDSSETNGDKKEETEDGEVKKEKEEEKAESDVVEDLDEDTKREDRVASAGLEAIMREYAFELAKEPSKSSEAVVEKEKALPKKDKDLLMHSKDTGFDDMEMEDEKREIINREINKFRDRHKDDDEDKDKDRDKERNLVREREIRRQEEKRQRERMDRMREQRERESTKERDRERERERERASARVSRSRSRSNSPAPSRSRRRSRSREMTSRDRSRERRKEREIEEEEEAYERRKLEKKLREKEAAYQERLKNWESRERKKSREHEKENEREDERKVEEAREGRRLKEFLEDYDDLRDDPKFYKGSALQRRQKEREKEKELDNRDRQREKEEFEEIKRKLFDEGHPDAETEVARMEREREEHLQPRLHLQELKAPNPPPPPPESESEDEPLVHERLQPERPRPESPKQQVHQPSRNSAPPLPPQLPPHMAGGGGGEHKPSPSLSTSPISTDSRISAPGLFMDESSQSSLPPTAGPTLSLAREDPLLAVRGKRLGPSVSPDSSSLPGVVPAADGKRKKLTVGDVFNQDDDDNGEPKKRKLVPLDYDEEKSTPTEKKTATAEEKRQKIKLLIESIPTAKDELYAFTVDWDIVDQSLMDKRIKPWVTKKIVEYIGEEEQSLTDFICQKVVARSTPQSIQNDVAMILDEEAEVFVVKMWRLLVYETEAKKLGLVK